MAQKAYKSATSSWLVVAHISQTKPHATVPSSPSPSLSGQRSGLRIPRFGPEERHKPKHELKADRVMHEKDDEELGQPPVELTRTMQVYKLRKDDPGGDHNRDDLSHA